MQVNRFDKPVGLSSFETIVANCLVSEGLNVVQRIEEKLNELQFTLDRLSQTSPGTGSSRGREFTVISSTRNIYAKEHKSNESIREAEGITQSIQKLEEELSCTEKELEGFLALVNLEEFKKAKAKIEGMRVKFDAMKIQAQKVMTRHNSVIKDLPLASAFNGIFTRNVSVPLWQASHPEESDFDSFMRRQVRLEVEAPLSEPKVNPRPPVDQDDDLYGP